MKTLPNTLKTPPIGVTNFFTVMQEFLQLDFKFVDTGHFVHLELPPEAWCEKL